MPPHLQIILRSNLSSVAGYIMLALVLVIPYASVYAQSSAPLFAADNVINVSIDTDWSTLLKDRGEDPDEHPGQVRYVAESGDTVSLGVQLRVRGNFRRNPDHCVFPPLRLNFKKKQVEGTLFDGQDRLKLVTHCQHSDRSYEQRTLLEYLAYKMYNQVTDASFRVRLLSISYEGLSGKRKDLHRYGFLIEDEDALAERLGGEITEPDQVSLGSVDPDQLFMLSMFQYMIGNTDWSIPFTHNIKMVAQGGVDTLIPIPYDFDWSGLVDAPYATPAENLPIDDVRDRWYRGYCQPADAYALVVDVYNGQKEEILSLINQFDPLIKPRRKYARRFISQFYKILNNSRSTRRNIVDRCRVS